MQEIWVWFLGQEFASRRDMLPTPGFLGFPGGSVSRESICKVGDLSLIPELGRSSGRGHGNSLQYSCLENPHGQRSLVGCSTWGWKESDITEWLSTQHMCSFGFEGLRQGEWKVHQSQKTLETLKQALELVNCMGEFWQEFEWRGRPQAWCWIFWSMWKSDPEAGAWFWITELSGMISKEAGCLHEGERETVPVSGFGWGGAED